MKEIKDKLVDKIVILVSVYTIGVLLAVLLNLLRVLGRIRILHWERFPRYRDNPELYKNGLIAVCNHPSLLDPILISALFFREYLLHPFKLSPWNTPNKKNYDRFYWQWARPRLIWIDKKNPREAGKAFIKLKNVINSGGIGIIFPEGGRTFKREKLYSKTGKEIAILEEGIALLIMKTNAPVLSFWVEGSDRFFPNTIWIEGQKSRFPFPRLWEEITVKVNRPMCFRKTNKVEIIQQVANALLNLADEEE